MPPVSGAYSDAAMTGEHGGQTVQGKEPATNPEVTMAWNKNGRAAEVTAATDAASRLRRDLAQSAAHAAELSGEETIAHLK